MRNGHEQNKIKVNDRITSTNVRIQWALEYDKPTRALYKQHDPAVFFKIVCQKINSKFQISLKSFKM